MLDVFSSFFIVYSVRLVWEASSKKVPLISGLPHIIFNFFRNPPTALPANQIVKDICHARCDFSLILSLITQRATGVGRLIVPLRFLGLCCTVLPR